jgi:hypothetical protein
VAVASKVPFDTYVYCKDIMPPVVKKLPKPVIVVDKY